MAYGTSNSWTPPHRDGDAVVYDVCVDDLPVKVIEVCEFRCALRPRRLLGQPAAPLGSYCRPLHAAPKLS